jgi:hypothetical protein
MMQPEWREFLQNHFDVDTYTVGNEKNSLNPFTGLPEFYDGAGMGGGASSGFMDSLGSGMASLGNSIGQAIGGYLGDAYAGASGPVGAGFGVDGGSMSGGDNAPSVYANPLQAAAAQVASPSVSSMAPLPNPMTPNVPDTVPQLGEYYNLMRQGDTAGAENMLSRFMRGDSNVYGR